MSRPPAKHVVSNARQATQRSAGLRDGLPVVADPDEWPPPTPVTRALIANGDFLAELEEEDRWRRLDARMCAFAKRRRLPVIAPG